MYRFLSYEQIDYKDLNYILGGFLKGTTGKKGLSNRKTPIQNVKVNPLNIRSGRGGSQI